jgi:hypothetical protein
MLSFIWEAQYDPTIDLRPNEARDAPTRNELAFRDLKSILPDVDKGPALRNITARHRLSNRL